jgi:hypothetical protein
MLSRDYGAYGRHRPGLCSPVALALFARDVPPSGKAAKGRAGPVARTILPLAKRWLARRIAARETLQSGLARSGVPLVGFLAERSACSAECLEGAPGRGSHEGETAAGEAWHVPGPSSAHAVDGARTSAARTPNGGARERCRGHW